MWYLIEDFFEQSWIMKLFQLWGWASVLIMVLSFGDNAYSMIKAAQEKAKAQEAAPAGHVEGHDSDTH